MFCKENLADGRRLKAFCEGWVGVNCNAAWEVDVNVQEGGKLSITEPWEKEHMIGGGTLALFSFQRK